jgi:hypothetical protein
MDSADKLGSIAARGFSINRRRWVIILSHAEKLASCVLAIVKHEAGEIDHSGRRRPDKQEVVYSLPLGVTPGSVAAQAHAHVSRPFAFSSLILY